MLGLHFPILGSKVVNVGFSVSALAVSEYLLGVFVSGVDFILSQDIAVSVKLDETFVESSHELRVLGVDQVALFDGFFAVPVDPH